MNTHVILQHKVKKDPLNNNESMFELVCYDTFLDRPLECNSLRIRHLELVYVGGDAEDAKSFIDAFICSCLFRMNYGQVAIKTFLPTLLGQEIWVEYFSYNDSDLNNYIKKYPQLFI